MKLTNRRWAIIGTAVVIMLAGLTFIGVACGDSDDDADGDADMTPSATETGAADAAAEQVEATILAYVDAWNAKDVGALLATFTDDGLQDQFIRTREEARDFLPVIIGEPPVDIGEFSDTQVTDDSATTRTDFFIGIAGSPQTFSLNNEGGVWLIDDQNPVTGTVPGDATTVDLSMTEYAFNFDATAATTGDLVFNVSNDGVELHEVTFYSVPEGPALDEVLQSEDAELVGQLFGVEAGTEATLTFSSNLAAGRYAMFCFLPTPDGGRHFALGMVSEFTIE